MDKIKAIKNIGKLKLIASTVEEIERDTETEIEKIEPSSEDSCLLVDLSPEWTSRTHKKKSSVSMLVLWPIHAYIPNK